MTEEEFINYVMEQATSEEAQRSAEETLQRIKNGERSDAEMVLELKEQDIMKVLKCSYIAERFFGKSLSWFCHKLNHDMVNGKRADFTKEERAKLKDALDTIAYEIQILSDSM
ncbi:MAG: DUF5053 domain-containing protein [Muribaculaceae bacterium]|nr:DUF5053 domain-containing protein [Muribaculaceae bacterium]